MPDQLDPLVGIELLAFEAVEFDGRFPVEIAVRPHEVVVDDEERGERAGAVEVLEPGAGAGVELVGAVEPFDELLVFAVGLAFGVEVFESDDGPFVEDARAAFFDGCGVVGGDGAVVGGQSVGDEFAGGAFGILWGSVAVVDQREGGLGTAGFGEVPAADGAAHLGDDEPGVAGDAVDLDVGFIGGAGVFGLRRILIGEVAQVQRGGVGVVDDGLVRDADSVDPAQGVGGHAGAEAEADVVGQAEPDGVQAVVDAVEVDGGFFQALEPQIFRGVVVFAEEVVQLELAGFTFFSHPVFFRRERGEVADIECAGVVLAFEGGAQSVLLPGEERATAVRTPVLGLAFAARLVGRRRL